MLEYTTISFVCVGGEGEGGLEKFWGENWEMDCGGRFLTIGLKIYL